MKSKENLVQTREILREEIVAFPLSLEDNPKLWWKNFTQLYKNLRRKSRLGPPPLNEYLEIQLDRVREVLKKNLPEIKKTILPEETNKMIASITDSLILQVSREMAVDFSPRVENIKENLLTIGQLVEGKSNQISASEIMVNNIHFIKIGLRKSEHAQWHHLLLPAESKIGLKGGPPRALLDIVAGAPKSMIDAELPWNDIDVVATGSETKARQISEIMGVDPEGLEMLTHKASEIDFTLYCLGRDTTQNQAYLDAKGLHYSDNAWRAAKTGETEVIGQYIRGRAIYGVDVLNFGGVELVKPRGMMRLVKPVVEGKALSFEYKPASAVMDFGIYWLFLARKWSDREVFGEYLQRLYYLGKQMDQVRPEENDIFAVLRRAHETYPFFDFFSPPMDLVGVTKWKAGKLIKQADREFSWKYRIPSGLKIPQEAKDLTPITISLKGFSSSQAKTEAIITSWPDFLAGCRKRTADFYKENKDIVHRFFLKTDLEESILDQYADFED